MANQKYFQLDPDEDPKPFDINNVPWYECLEILLKDYEPAEKAEQADTFYSTNDISDAISRHFGIPADQVYPHDIYQCMLHAGYHYASRGSLHLEWMLKSK